MVVPVRDVIFTQDSIGSTFADGRQFEELIKQLHNGEVDPLKRPFMCLEAVKFDGQIRSLDNRRLYCLKEYQKQVSHEVKVRLQVSTVQDKATLKFLQRCAPGCGGGSNVTVRRARPFWARAGLLRTTQHRQALQANARGGRRPSEHQREDEPASSGGAAAAGDADGGESGCVKNLEAPHDTVENDSWGEWK